MTKFTHAVKNMATIIPRTINKTAIEAMIPETKNNSINKM